MRIILILFIGIMPGHAQENEVSTFAGTAPLTTGLFKVQDKWEVRWDAPHVIRITLLGSDGTVIAGTSASATGSLYQPKGGNFYLQIDGTGGDGATPWHVSVVEIGTALTPSTNAASANYIPPTDVPPPGQAGAAAISSNAATNAAPVALTAPAPAAKLSEAQTRAIVVIKGDAGEGTGFMVKGPDGPAVVTNIHVISANPNIRILTTDGRSVKILAYMGAVDRDLAMLTIQDDHYSYLDLATDVEHTAQIGDEVITPGNSEGGEDVLNTDGKLVGIGPDNIEFSNPIYHGNSGGPVFHIASGKVIGVVAMARKVNVSNDLDKASFASQQSAITSTMRYFGFRIDSVPHWETYDWNRFLNETTFLKNFRQTSRCLDSYLNGSRYENAHLTNEDPNYGAPNSQYFLRNDKIKAANDNFHQFAAHADNSQRMDAQRELVSDLEGIADQDMATIQAMDNFYSFDQILAKQDIDYRNHLKAELNNIDGKISDSGH